MFHPNTTFNSLKRLARNNRHIFKIIPAEISTKITSILPAKRSLALVAVFGFFHFTETYSVNSHMSKSAITQHCSIWRSTDSIFHADIWPQDQI